MKNKIRGANFFGAVPGRDVEEGCLALGGHGLGQHGLAGAWNYVEDEPFFTGNVEEI